MKEKSYMLAIPQNEDDIDDLDGILARLSDSPYFQLISHDFDDRLKLVLQCDEKEYGVELVPMDIVIPEMYRICHFFPDVDVDAVEKTDFGIGVVMEFGEDVLASYHLQLRIIHTVLPDLLAVLDDSSEKILSGKWVQLAAKSAIPPAPRYIYSVQAVTDDTGCVWLHSHGLNRCGLPEMEILNSTTDTYANHYNLLEAMANRLLEQAEPIGNGEPFFVARVTGQIPLIATLVGWEEAVALYPDDMVGSKKDREEGHNQNTCGLFVYASPEDIENRKYSPVSVFDDLLKDNPIYIISTAETERMKALAAERLPYMLKAAQDKDNKVLVKIGLAIDEEYRKEQNNFEHIWFELLETTDNHVKCRLTQEPYYVKDMHAGSEGVYPFGCITDWLIYTKDQRLTADDVYLLDYFSKGNS